MSEKNRAATVAAAQPRATPQLNGKKKDVEWPVETAADLTADHVPPKVRDQLVREWRRKAEALGKVLIEFIESRNDLLTNVNSAMKAANKDGQRLQSFIVAPEVLETLEGLGLVKQQAPPKPPEA